MENGPIEAEVLERVIVRCSHCGQHNGVVEIHKSRQLRCGRCRAPLANPFRLHNRMLRWSQAQPLAIVLLIACVGSLLLGGKMMSRRGKLALLQQQFKAELATIERANQQKLEADEKAHQALLLDDNFIQGRKANEAHKKEWEQRMSHEPQLARTPIEKTMREMEALGNNPDLPAREILEKVAQMSSPYDSRIEVIESRGKFVIKVAYRMSSMTLGELGAITKHHSVDSLRKEVVEISSKVVRDLYDYCGRRGIRRIMVSCNHPLKRIPGNTPPSEREEAFNRAPVVWGVLYRCTIPEKAAQTVPSWRKLPLHRITDMLEAEDGFRNLDIRNQGPRGDWQVLPEGDLEF